MTLNYIICYGLWIIYFIQRIYAKSASESDSESAKIASLRLFTNDPIGVTYIDATIKFMACLNSALNGIVHLARGSQIRREIARFITMVTTTISNSDNHAGAPVTFQTQTTNARSNRQG